MSPLPSVSPALSSCRGGRGETPRRERIVVTLQERGWFASSSIFHPLGIRTDAPLDRQVAAVQTLKTAGRSAPPQQPATMTMVVALERGKMEVTQVKKSKNELEVQISGANETLLGPLLNRTLADPQVDYASYYMRHIVLDDPRFYVRTKKGTPKAPLDRAMESIIADIHAIQDKLAK